jgi:hypothetical protein
MHTYSATDSKPITLVAEALCRLPVATHGSEDWRWNEVAACTADGLCRLPEVQGYQHELQYAVFRVTNINSSMLCSGFPT